ncbi:phytoene desaturase family protein [Myxococcus xanthus]|uniref:Phytoene dehydrogenase n=1 Tax=Myxococcus xanthus TaxID=34 RepID=A0A7Y4IQN5_MYXXA|nr:phytoene desaturase family protein [Myxococcus xanthus]NOJ83496.1 phytoene desaturase [Myxococcus xanthus]NOJ90346.1 phytoene desaturase [Myxococcus xanthus]
MASEGGSVRHVIVVGAGPGGLSAAINLAGQGFRVTVVEKDAVPGGRMKGLTLGASGEYAVDTGPSILQLPGVLEQIFRRAGRRLEDYVKLLPLDVNTRVHFWDGTHLDTTRHLDRMEAELAKFGPRQASALRQWMEDGREKYGIAYEKFICTSADNLGYYAPWRLAPTLRFKPWQTLYRQLDGFFHDDRVTYALAYPSKYLGLHPTTCSSVFSVIPFLELAFGVWHVEGGFRELSRGMMRCAQDLGATFRMGTPVEQVRVDAGRAVGVKLVGGEVLDADAVVVNADLAYAARSLIPAEAREGSRLTDAALERAKYSCSTFMAYYGLDTVYADLPHHLIYLSESARRTDRDALEDRHVDLEDPPFYVCNPGVTDPSGAPAGHSTLYVLVPTPNTGRPVDWAKTEQALRERIPAMLEKVGLKGVREHIREERYFTAETWRDDFNVFRGAVFNLSHTWLQLGPLRPKVKNRDIEGLYFVGGGTHPGSGLLTIMESANIAADYLTREAGKGPLPGWPYVPPLAPEAPPQARAG